MNPIQCDDRQEREVEFAFRIRQALNEATEQIPAAKLEQLAAARKAALRAQNHEHPIMQWAQQAVLAGGARQVSSNNKSGFVKLVVASCLFLLVGACLIGLFQLEQQRHTEELADIDTALLIDDIPISAYADHGFNAYIKKSR